MLRKSRTAIAVLGLGLHLASSDGALSAEGSAGFYLLGSKQEMAGFLPPPGLYVIDTNYFYSGRTNATLSFSGLTLSGGVKADTFYNLPSLLWVTPAKVLGGNLAFSATTPIAWKEVRAERSLAGPGGAVIGANIAQSDTAFGDPVLGASLGWHEGNWHWNVGALYNAPIGFWQLRNPSNIGFHRSAVDATGAITWMDPKTGLEISTAAGFTFNFENSATQYTTGTEFHVEWALMQHLSKSLALGLVGYHYQQVTGDTGAGARLGDFEGRVTALGGAVNYTFLLGQIPVSSSVKYMKEFGAKNRLEGDVGMLTLSMPLSVTPPPAEPLK